MLGDTGGGIGLIQRNAYLFERQVVGSHQEPGPERPGGVIFVCDNELHIVLIPQAVKMVGVQQARHN
jgi:hypothetical protein